MDISAKIISGQEIHILEALKINKSEITDLFNSIVTHVFTVEEDKDLNIPLAVEKLFIPLMYMDMQQDAKLELDMKIDKLFRLQKEFLQETGEVEFRFEN